MLDVSDKRKVAYIVGVSLGDGNLSNPNGRAVRLRVTCDKKYPKLMTQIERAIKSIAPQNKVGRIDRGNCVDIYCYSNDWEKVLGWKAKLGSKFKQNVKVPNWILSNQDLHRSCLQGLFETDGSVYKDRKYLTINFVTQIPSLATSVKQMLSKTNYNPSIQKLKLPSGKTKFTFRIHRNAEAFLKEFKIKKK